MVMMELTFGMVLKMINKNIMGVDKYVVGIFSKVEGVIIEVIKSFDLNQLDKAKQFLRNLRYNYDNDFRLAKEIWQGTGSTDYDYIRVRSRNKGGKK